MGKIFVKLKEAGTIFHDSLGNQSVSGVAIVEVEKTEKIATALNSGILIECTQSDFEKYDADNTKKIAEARSSMKIEEQLELEKKDNIALKKKVAELEAENAKLKNLVPEKPKEAEKSKAQPK